MRDIDVVLWALLVAVLLVWVEQRRSIVVIVLFPRERPTVPMATAAGQSEPQSMKRIGFAYA